MGERWQGAEGLGGARERDHGRARSTVRQRPVVPAAAGAQAREVTPDCEAGNENRVGLGQLLWRQRTAGSARRPSRGRMVPSKQAHPGERRRTGRRTRAPPPSAWREGRRLQAPRAGPRRGPPLASWGGSDAANRRVRAASSAAHSAGEQEGGRRVSRRAAQPSARRRPLAYRMAHGLVRSQQDSVAQESEEEVEAPRLPEPPVVTRPACGAPPTTRRTCSASSTRCPRSACRGRGRRTR